MTTTEPEWIVPDWPAPTRIRALVSTRIGGVSQAPYDSLNLGDHVGDEPAAVTTNRQRLVEAARLPAAPQYLSQRHGTRVEELPTSGPLQADACLTRKENIVCAVLTADCLPVLLCDEAGTVVAAAHAGWRGLLNGVIENTVAAMAVPSSTIHAWLGPAIGPQAFEVGPEVREAFICQCVEYEQAFRAAEQDRYLADIYTLAQLRLAALGVERICGDGLCTYNDAERFYSYRRDGQTGRMASLIWISAA